MQLRAAALDRKLTPLEWSAVLLHLIKHRGYLSQRKNEGETADKELGALLKGVATMPMPYRQAISVHRPNWL